MWEKSALGKTYPAQDTTHQAGYSQPMTPHDQTPAAAVPWYQNDAWIMNHAATIFCLCEHDVDSDDCSIITCDIDESCTERHGVWKF